MTSGILRMVVMRHWWELQSSPQWRRNIYSQAGTCFCGRYNTVLAGHPIGVLESIIKGEHGSRELKNFFGFCVITVNGGFTKGNASKQHYQTADQLKISNFSTFFLYITNQVEKMMLREHGTALSDVMTTIGWTKIFVPLLHLIK